MFSKNTPASPQPAMMAVPAAAAPKRVVGRSGTAPSIISADLTVTGMLVSSGDIQIDGVVEGDVRSVGLVIGEKAEIHGEVLAEDITVRGRVIGRIRARKVQLASTSHVEGDILHEAFAVEAGAFFEGNCRHSDNPLGDEARIPLSHSNPAAAAPQDNNPAPQTNSPRTGLAGLTPVGQPI